MFHNNHELDQNLLWEKRQFKFLILYSNIQFRSHFTKYKILFDLPVNEIVANVLRSKGGAHQRQIPCAAG